MWVFFSIVSLLIRTTVGSPEADSIRPNIMQLKNTNNNSFDSRTEKSAIDATNKWKNEVSTSIESGKKLINPSDASEGLEESKNFDKKQNRRSIDSDVKIVAKKRETVGSWLNSSSKNKGFQNLIHEEKDPWIYWWRDKSSRIRRPIRVPFNSWGGKRGKEYPRSNVNVQSKRTKFTYTDKDDRNVFVDRYGVKRMSEIGKEECKMPFNSWGGKRARKSLNQDPNWQQLVLVTKPVFNDASRTPVSFKDAFLEKENFGNINDGKPMIFDKWDGKRNNFLYRILFSRAINATNVNNYVTEEEIANNDSKDDDDDDYDSNDWLTLMPEKKTEHSRLRKTTFNTRGDKRSSETYALRFGDEYFTVPARGRKVFFPWGG